MSLATTMKNRLKRPAPGNVDPAHAFGSEEQLMAEFQRQEYVQPQPKSSVLTGLRDRLSTLTARPHATDAPVYSADTYGHENAPDLGWEAAFDPEAAARAAEEPVAPSAAERFEQFRHTVYSSNVRPAPLYEEISFSSAPKRESAYRKPVYEEITFSPRPRQSATAAPIYEDLTPGARTAPMAAPAYADVPPSQGAPMPEMPGTDHPAPANSAPAKRGSDLPYVFWSGSILVGVVLTLFSFVYACAM